MGYRLEIKKIVETDNSELKIIDIFYGTKLYGYEEENTLLSYIYLVSIGKLEHDEYFGYNSNQMICLNKKEFTIFSYLYNMDYNNYKTPYEKKIDDFINQESIKQELLDDIREYDNYVYLISWC